jgi:nicotinate (nicotinamide) nucleotide adenylyltransferase
MGNTVELICYGGSFDPPHAGHYDCVKLAAKRFPNSTVLILPSLVPTPYMGETAKIPQASFAQRVQMCSLCFHNLQLPNLKISELEKSLPQPNYTVHSLQTLREQMPTVSIAFMVGQDQLQSFHLWYKPTDILRLASLIVCRREATTNNDESLQDSVKNMANRLSLTLTWEDSLTASIRDYPHAIYLLDGEISPAASHLIRDQFAHDQTIPEGWVQTAVLEYAQTERLYKKGF